MKSLRLKEGGGWRLEVCFKLHLGLRARFSLEFVSSFLLFFSLPVNYHSLHKFSTLLQSRDVSNYLIIKHSFMNFISLF